MKARLTNLSYKYLVNELIDNLLENYNYTSLLSLLGVYERR